MALKTIVPIGPPFTFNDVCEVVNQSFNGTNGEHLFGAGGLFAKATGTFNPSYVGSKDRLSNFRGYQHITDYYTIKIVYGNYIGGSLGGVSYFKIMYTKSNSSMPALNPYGIIISGSIKFNEIGNQSGTVSTCAILSTQTANNFVFSLVQNELKKYIMSLMEYNEFFDTVTGCYNGQPTYGDLDKTYGNFTLNKYVSNGYGLIIQQGFTTNADGFNIEIFDESYEFVMQGYFTSDTNACAFNDSYTDPITLYSDTAVLSIGSKLYTNYTLSTLFSGTFADNYWLRLGSKAYLHKVNNNGVYDPKITQITQCSTGPVQVGIPTGLVKLSSTPTSLYITWNNVATATTYNIYSNGILVGTTSDLTYIINGLNGGTVHSIQVSAENSIGEGTKCSVVNMLTEEALPILEEITYYFTDPCGISMTLWKDQYDGKHYTSSQKMNFYNGTAFVFSSEDIYNPGYYNWDYYQFTGGYPSYMYSTYSSCAPPFLEI